MSLPPVTEGQSVSTSSVDVPLPTTTTVAHTSSSGPTFPTSLQARDPELVAASEALCMLHEGPKISETQDISQVLVEDYEEIVCSIGFGVDPRPFSRTIDSNAEILPSRSTPLDEISEIRSTLGTQFVDNPPPWSTPLPLQ